MCPEEFIFPTPGKSAAFTDEWACQERHLARLAVVELMIRRAGVIGDDEGAKTDNDADDNDVYFNAEM